MGRREYYSWFPIANEQINHPDFKSLTPTQKLYYWFVVSEYNYFMAELGEYYRSDQWIASALGVKERTIREARRTCQKKGFIKTVPGRRNLKTGQAIATQYKYVKWSLPNDIEGGYAKFIRHHLGMLLNKVRDPRTTIYVEDVVIYIYLDFIRDRYRDNDFFVTKRELREMTRIKKAPESVRNLYEDFRFASGNHLFEFEDNHQKFHFEEWREALEPQEDDTAYENAMVWEDEIKRNVEEARRQQKEKELDKLRSKGKSEGTIYVAEDLLDYFREKYIEKYKKPPSIDYGQKDRLIEMGEAFSPQFVAGIIDFYFSEKDVPNPTGAKYRTLSRFLRSFDELDLKKEGLMKTIT